MMKKAIFVLMLMAIAPFNLHAEDTIDDQFYDESSLLFNVFYGGSIISTISCWYHSIKAEQLIRRFKVRPPFTVAYAIGKHHTSKKWSAIACLACLGAAVATMPGLPGLISSFNRKIALSNKKNKFS